MNKLVYQIGLFSLLLFTCKTWAQTPFTGKIIYTVQMVDTNLQKIIDNREMSVYTNDTLSRIEVMNDALGEQITIKHLGLKKSYLLMSMLGKKLAIQTDSSENSTVLEPYQFRYIWFGRKKVDGFVLKKAKVYREDLKEEKTIWYFRDIRPDLMDMYPGIKGLPADFYIGTVDGLVHYQVKLIKNQFVAKDLFGVPSDYEKIRLSDFMNHVRGAEN